MITISNTIAEQGQKRFVISHELGYFYNHREEILRCSALDMMTSGSTPGKESEANAFASELLMKKEWFMNHVEGINIDAHVLIETAKYFKVSLSAAAL